jgi:formamidopyrimidine-DNA glycosylase
MPELPEIEIVKRSLFKMINKAKIIDIKINNKNLRYKIPPTFCKSLIGEKILNISRRSKYLIFYFEKKNSFSTSWYEWKIINNERT